MKSFIGRLAPWALGSWLAAVLSTAAAELPWLIVPADPNVAGSDGMDSANRSVAGPAREPAGFGPMLAVGRAGAGVAPSTVRAGERWRLPWPDGDPVVIVVGEVLGSADGFDRVRGRVEGEPASDVILGVGGDRVVGTVRRDSGAMAVVQPWGEGRLRMALRRADEGPVCGNRDQPDGHRAGVSLQSQVAAPAAAGAGAATNWVDVAFFGTRSAEEAAGGPAGLRALVDLAVVESNDTFARSGASVRLRRVCFRTIDAPESGDLAKDLSRLMQASDGWADEVHRLRDEHAADVVCLVTEYEDTRQFAGMANQLRDTSASSVARGFLVCLRPYLLGNYTLAHEVGHVMGGNHDRENAGGGGLHAWSYGHRPVIEGQTFRTVMAYRPGRQFPHFSNPRVSYRGVPTGVAGIADNVRTLNATAPLIAAVREPSSAVGFRGTPIAVREDDGVVRVVLERSGRLEAVEVGVRTRDGSARAGLDYEAVDTRITWPAGRETFEVEVRLLDNGRVDGPREFGLRLVEPTSGLTLGPVAEAEVVIADDEVEATALLDTAFLARPGADHGVQALAAAGDGAVIVGGTFTTFNDAGCWRLARVLPDGSVDPGFRPEVKYAVQALATAADGRIILGGEFNTVDGERRNHVAVLSSDGRLDPSFTFDPGSDLPVLAVAPAPSGGWLIGGRFTTVQGGAASRVARLTATGALDSTFDTRGGPDGDVHALAVAPEGRVLVGGSFTNVGGQRRPGLVRLGADGRWDADFVVGAGADGPVRALARDEAGRWLAAGEFRSFDGRPAVRIVRLFPDGGVDTSFATGNGPNDTVRSVLAAAGGGVWIAGDFTEVDGVVRRRVARLTEDGRLDERFDPGVGPDDRVHTLLEAANDRLYVGGGFRSVNGLPRGGVAALLATRPPPARFETAGVGGLGFEWEARVWPRQTYQLLRSTDLRSWSMEGESRSEDGSLRGVVAPSSAAGEFLRLRRRLE